MLVLEDLHWSDPSTVEALAMLARRREPARLLVLGTYRAVEVVVHEHPLQAIKQELVAHGQRRGSGLERPEASRGPRVSRPAEGLAAAAPGGRGGGGLSTHGGPSVVHGAGGGLSGAAGARS